MQADRGVLPVEGQLGLLRTSEQPIPRQHIQPVNRTVGIRSLHPHHDDGFALEEDRAVARTGDRDPRSQVALPPPSPPGNESSCPPVSNARAVKVCPPTVGSFQTIVWTIGTPGSGGLDEDDLGNANRFRAVEQLDPADPALLVDRLDRDRHRDPGGQRSPGLGGRDRKPAGDGTRIHPHHHPGDTTASPSVPLARAMILCSPTAAPFHSR